MGLGFRDAVGEQEFWREPTPIPFHPTNLFLRLHFLVKVQAAHDAPRVHLGVRASLLRTEGHIGHVPVGDPSGTLTRDDNEQRACQAQMPHLERGYA